MSEPEIVTYGRSFVQDYSPDEYRASLIRAFRDRRMSYVVLDSNPRGRKYLAACIAWAIDQGLVHNDRNEDDGQSKVSSFRLTPLGELEILGQ